MDRTQSALLKAVAADPHNDLPRLVYADYLEENGNPDRAEIIRVQCELARLQEGDCDGKYLFERLCALPHGSQRIWDLDWNRVDTDVGRRLALHSRMITLETKFTAEWHDAEAPKDVGASFSLDRGFFTFARVWSDADHALFRAALKRGAFTLPFSGYFNTSSRPPVTQAEAKKFNLLDSLVSISVGLDPAVPRWFENRWQTATIRHFRCVGWQTNAVLLSLADSTNWSGLRSIEYTQAEDGADSLGVLARLASADHLAGVQNLNLGFRSESLTTAVLSTVANGKWRHLRQLTVKGFNPRTNPSVFANGTALSELRSLSIDGPVERLGTLFTSKQLANLSTLSIMWQAQGLDASTASKSTLTKLQWLELQIDAETLVALAGSPVMASLRVLVLWVSEGASAEQWKHFFAAIRCPNLVFLRLLVGEGASAAAKALAKCPHLPQLQGLSLNGEIGLVGAKALVASPHLGQLRYLHTYEQAATPAGMELLRKRFGVDAVG